MIVVDLSELTFSLYENGNLLITYHVAIGSNSDCTGKHRVGDKKTPIGIFRISQKVNLIKMKKPSNIRLFVEKFANLLGFSTFYFGGYWMRLKAYNCCGYKTKDWKGIGIHGLMLPPYLWEYHTLGCIGLTHNDVKKVFRKIKIGTLVVLKP